MKVWKKILTILTCALCVCLASMLCACGSDTSTTQTSDVNEMREVSNSDTEEDAFWVLIVGNDSREGTTEIDDPYYSNGIGRSDTMMLAHINLKTYEIALVTIPRDTETEFDDGTTGKINDALYRGGMDELLKEVKKLTGVSPRYYLNADFVQFENLVDELGGVTADVPIDMHLVDIVSGENISLEAGEQELDGAEALVLARVRKLYADNLDACRQIQDRQIVEQLIKQVAENPSAAKSSVQTLLSYTSTNWPLDDLVSTVSDFSQNASKISFISGTGPYAGGIDDETDLWFATRDEATWKRVINAAANGQDITNIVPLPEVEAKE